MTMTSPTAAEWDGSTDSMDGMILSSMTIGMDPGHGLLGGHGMILGTGAITAIMACTTPGSTAAAGDTGDGVTPDGDGLIMADSMDGMILGIMVPDWLIVAPMVHATMVV